MMKLSGALALCALVYGLAGGMSPAMAQYNLRTLPSPPVAGSTFEVAFDDDDCEIFFLGAPGEPPEISLQGQVLRVAVDQAPVIDCSSAFVTYTLSAGPLPAGSYTLQLYGRSFGSPGTGGTLQTIPFDVVVPTVSAPATIPANRTAWMLALGGLMMLLAYRRTG